MADRIHEVVLCFHRIVCTYEPIITRWQSLPHRPNVTELSSQHGLSLSCNGVVTGDYAIEKNLCNNLQDYRSS